jgi:2-succinyl-6-hydroxy-2,4-cyclohexadiene-1-carboxylate synthase
VLTRLNGVEFHVEVEGNGPPLLLLHGFTGSTRSWDEVRSELVGSARVIALDLIGHGLSASPDDPRRYTLAWSACDLLALLDALELEQVDVLGYSMGGRVALYFALHHVQRVRRLILESASPGIQDDAERERRVQSDEALAQRVLTRGIDAFVSEWQRQPLLQPAPHVSAERRAAQRAQRLNNQPIGLANSLRGMGTGQQGPLWPKLSDLQLPVLLIVGEHDLRYRETAARMHDQLPASRLCIVPGAGHTVHLDQPRCFVHHVTNFLTTN